MDLLNTYEMCHKTHGMVTRYGSQDTEGIPDTQDSTPFESHTTGPPCAAKGDNDSSDEYCEETDTLLSLG